MMGGRKAYGLQSTTLFVFDGFIVLNIIPETCRCTLEGFAVASRDLLFIVVTEAWHLIYDC